MRIVELCLSPGRGGMELYMARTARALAASHTVLPVVTRGESLLRPTLEEMGLPCTALAVRLRELPLLAARRLARLIDAEAIDVVHAHWRSDLPLAAIAKRLSRRRPRLVYTCQMKVSHPKTDPYHHFIYGQVDALLAITRQLAGQLRERLHPALRDRVRTLYYGTEPGVVLGAPAREALRREHGLAPGSFVVGLFGQKFEGKGQHLLLDALGRLRREGVPAQGLIVGPVSDPAYAAGLERQAAALGLAGAVVSLDFVREPQALMQACDCVVLATYQETFGLVLIEAMSVGVAVVGSDAGGVPEIIEHGRTGLLFATRDAASLHTQLRALHADPALRARLAAAGREQALHRFSAARHYAALLEVMQGRLEATA